MSKQQEASKVLSALGMPAAQANERSALTLLALADLGPDDHWSVAQQPLLRTVDMMEFMSSKYGKRYKPNSRETIRRQTLHHFVRARLVDINPDDPARPTNSGHTRYAFTDRMLAVVRSYGGPAFDRTVASFVEDQGDYATCTHMNAR